MKVDHYTRKLVRLRMVADHIDANLGQTLCLDELAGIASMSRYHFERVFNDYAGETPVARVRRLRLAQARRSIERGQAPSLLELALECGYASAEAFSRAFRSCYGMAPSATQPQQIMPPPIRIEEVPALAIQYLPFKGCLRDSIAPFDALRAHALIAGVPRERRKGWCVQLSGDMGDPNSAVELQVGLLSERLGIRVPGLSMGHLPAGHYAVVRVTGSYAAPATLASRIETETGWQVTDAPVLRCFHNSEYLPAHFEKQCDLYIPVRR